MLYAIFSKFILTYVFYLIGGIIFHFSLNKTSMNGKEFGFSTVSLLLSSAINEIYMSSYEHQDFHWIQIPFYIFLIDFIYYFLHRFMHLPVVYDWIHAQHHQFKPPSSLSASSIGILETILTISIASLGPTFIFPFHPLVVQYVGVFLLVNSIFVHTNSGIDYPYFISPLKHYYHHLCGIRNTNFGLLTNFWDVLFQTN